MGKWRRGREEKKTTRREKGSVEAMSVEGRAGTLQGKVVLPCSVLPCSVLLRTALSNFVWRAVTESSAGSCGFHCG